MNDSAADVAWRFCNTITAGKRRADERRIEIALGAWERDANLRACEPTKEILGWGSVRSRTYERGNNVAAVRLLFVVSGRSGIWSAPGLASDQRMINLDGWCAWRLVGANNREVARSARTFPTFHECYQAARQVQRRLDLAALTVRHDDVVNLWAWRAEMDGVAVATSGRMYQRHRECQSNAAQFFELMPLAATAYDSTTVPAIGSGQYEEGYDDALSATLRLA
jgi:hypothetical protein